MKIKIERSVLLDALKQVQGVIPTKTVTPVIYNVKVVASADGSVVLTGTNLDITQIVTARAKVDEVGATTIPFKFLLSAVQKFDGMDVEIETNAKELSVVTCGMAVFRFSGMPAKTFPDFVADKVDVAFTVERRTIREMFRKTVYAVSTDKTRANSAMAGVYLSVKNGIATMMATDAFRASSFEVPIDGVDKSVSRDFVIPRETALVVMNAMTGDGNVTVEGRGAQIAFKNDDGNVIMSKLIDAPYPNLRMVMQKNKSEAKTAIEVDRDLFIRALDRVSIFSEDNIALRISFANNEMVLSCNDAASDARDIVPVKYDGAPFDILFTPKIALDPLKVIDDDTIVFNANGGLSPAVITCSIPFTAVLMPRRN